MTFRFHIPGVPHTATSKDYLCCAFTQKVLNLCKMLTERGHHVIHYGNELSDVVCNEHVSITAATDIGAPETSGTFDVSSPVYVKFNANAAREIAKRAQPKDFLLCAWPSHKTIADALGIFNLITVESGIGYPGGYFAPFKIFESYAMLHAYRGIDGVKTATGNGWWYDAVIPNYFDPADFKFSPSRGGYLLFLGLRSMGGEGKGHFIAGQIAEATGRKLIAAGPGTFPNKPDCVETTGFVGVEKRRELLAGADALLAPSLFVEPFCGASVEAMMSGTPVICTDWGAMSENVIHGVTGWRCRTMEQFVWAVNHIGDLSRCETRQWALDNFSVERVGAMYDEYFRMAMDRYSGNGWYEPRPERTDLDWLRRTYPSAAMEKAHAEPKRPAA